ncbi:MAG: cyclic nucleotide-binding domain-containing protein [Spirochaetota bacterium]
MGTNLSANKIFTEGFLRETSSKTYKKGEAIIQEGEPSNETMYCLVKGSCAVYKNKKHTLEKINELQPGDFFGEIALISDEPRSATVQVTSPTASLLLFSKKKFIEQTKSNPVLMYSILKATFARLIRAKVNNSNLMKVVPNSNPSLLIRLDSNQMDAKYEEVYGLLNSLNKLSFTRGDKIYSLNDPSNERMYFLQDGEITFVTNFNGIKIKTATLKPGFFFGEVSLVTRYPRENTIVVSSSTAKLVELDKKIFMQIIQLKPEFLYEQLKLAIWKLIHIEKETFALKASLEVQQDENDITVYPRDEVILEEGSLSNDSMYFILEGDFAVYKRIDKKQKLLNVLKTGEFFGEVALISSEARTATILVQSNTGKLLSINRKTFIQKTRSSPQLMFSILKATIIRLYRAEANIYSMLKKNLPNLEPDLQLRLEQSRSRNIDIFSYVHNIRMMQFTRMETVFTDREDGGEQMFFLIAGELIVTKKVENKELDISHLLPGDFFGEMSIVSDLPRTNTVRVFSDKAKVVALTRDVFKKIFMVNPKFLYSVMATVIWKLIAAEKAVNKLNLDFDIYGRE